MIKSLQTEIEPYVNERIEKVRTRITDALSELEQKGQTMQADNTKQRTSVEGHNDTLGQGLRKRADEYEDNRLSTAVGIGGPNKAERLLKNYQGDQQKATNANNKKK